MKKLASEIYNAVRSGKLKQPFNADMVRRAYPGWVDHTYTVFLPKHRVGNPGGNTKLFKQVGHGWYEVV